jgi:PIN domain nuclease of toxin-antitoxin system
VILLDTHAFVWWTAAPDKMSARARAVIDGASEVAVAAISVWEIAMLVAHGRLELDRDVLVWLKQALAQPRVCYVALTPEVAVAACSLDPPGPTDPADRMLIASALQLRVPIVTKDARIRAYERVLAIW